MQRYLLPLLLLCTAVGFAQSKRQLTVERIFQFPSLSGAAISSVQWSPDGSFVAYLRTPDTSHTKSLWLFDPAQGKSTLLTRVDDILKGNQKFSEEEKMVRERTRTTGAGFSFYAWAPGGREIITLLNGDVYGIDVHTKVVRQITQTSEPEFDPKLSPDGALLAFVRDDEIYIMNIAEQSELKLTSGATGKIKNGISEFVAQEEMDRTTGYWWAPDGKHIAYLQIDNTPVKVFHIANYLTDYTSITDQEYPKAGEANTIVKVGVVSVNGGGTTWLDLGTNPDIYVPRVQWLADGKQLAVQIQSRNQDTLDVRLYDAAQGTFFRLLIETDPTWVTLNDALTFLDTRKQFIWASERSGFNHLYLFGMNGKLVNQITKGDWEVDQLIGVDRKAGVVYFTATEKSAIERHLYSVKLDGSGFTRLSATDGWHEITLSPDASRYADVFSSIVRPPLMSVMTVDKSTARMIEANKPVALDSFALPSPVFLEVPSAEGGIMLNAFMIKPSSFDEHKKYPVVMYVYNGPTSRIVENRWGAGGGAARALWHRSMAEKGYIVFGVDGRGTPGRGRAFLNWVHERLGYIEVKDQVAGVQYLKSLPYVDPSRIMIWGKSYGGFMTSMAMCTTHDVFKLGIAVAPVTDFRNYDTHYTERYLELPQTNPDGYRLSAPVSFAAGLEGKFLLVHGVVDDNVHFQESIVFIDELQKANKQFDFMAYPKSTHSFAGDEVGTHLYNLLSRYIQANL